MRKMLYQYNSYHINYMKKVLIKNEYDMIIELRTLYGADCIIKIVHALPSFNRLLGGPMTKRFIKNLCFLNFFLRHYSKLPGS